MESNETKSTEPTTDTKPGLDPAGSGDGPAATVSLEIPRAVAALLGAAQCVVIACDPDSGIPFAWQGLRHGQLNLTALEGQTLVLLAGAKVQELMVGEAVIGRLAQLKAQEQKQKAGLFVPKGVV